MVHWTHICILHTHKCHMGNTNFYCCVLGHGSFDNFNRLKSCNRVCPKNWNAFFYFIFVDFCSSLLGADNQTIEKMHNARARFHLLVLNFTSIYISSHILLFYNLFLKSFWAICILHLSYSNVSCTHSNACQRTQPN